MTKCFYAGLEIMKIPKNQEKLTKCAFFVSMATTRKQYVQVPIFISFYKSLLISL